MHWSFNATTIDIFLPAEKTLTLKNTFFHVKSSFRYLSFSLNFLVMLENDLTRKLRLVSKFMTSQLVKNNYNEIWSVNKM